MNNDNIVCFCILSNGINYYTLQQITLNVKPTFTINLKLINHWSIIKTSLTIAIALYPTRNKDQNGTME